MRYIFILVICCFLTDEAGAQFNSKVGYNLSYANTSELTSLFEDFNSDREDWLDQKLTSINFIHGLEIGARYRVGNLAFELGIISGGGESEAVGLLPDTGTKADFRYRLSTFDYHINVTQFFWDIGFGSGIGRQRLTIKEYNQVSDNYDELSSEKQWTAKIFLQLEVPSKRVSFSFRPYYQFSFDSFDLSSAASSLGTSSANPMDYQVFGLSILFFNGPQP